MAARGRSGRRRRTTFSLPLLVAVGIAALVAGILGSRVLATGQESGGPGGEGGSSPAAGTRVDVIVKATDSSFWQTMTAGAQAAEEDYGIDVTVFGPPSETDIAEQVQLVENSISRGVDAIALAPNSSDALNGVIDRAREAEIPGIIVDNRVTTESDGFIGTDNLVAGSQAGQRLCELVQENSPDGGSVYIESAVAGIQVLEDRDGGFREGFEQRCPDYEVIGPRYNDNDIPTAAANVNDAITANRDLVGIFADNNTSGVGAAQAIRDNDAADRISVVAFDTDPAEVEALGDGTIDALVAQNPYFFGYQSVLAATSATLGEFAPPSLDPGGVLVDESNLQDPVIQRLVNPPTAEAQGA
jgi:ribose transport system substrate-binding protein